MIERILDWTDDFLKFRSKVESVFGNLEQLAETAPDIYAHMVLSHGFVEYSVVRKISEGVKYQIQSEKGSFNPKDPVHTKLYWAHLRDEYLRWARKNNLAEHLLDRGWAEFVND